MSHELSHMNGVQAVPEARAKYGLQMQVGPDVVMLSQLRLLPSGFAQVYVLHEFGPRSAHTSYFGQITPPHNFFAAENIYSFGW